MEDITTGVLTSTPQVNELECKDNYASKDYRVPHMLGGKIQRRPDLDTKNNESTKTKRKRVRAKNRRTSN